MWLRSDPVRACPTSCFCSRSGVVRSGQQKSSTQLWGVLIWKLTFQIIFISVAQTIRSLPAVQQTWFDPCVRKIPWRRKWQPTPVFLPGNSQRWRSLAGYSPWGHKESGMTELLFRFHEGLNDISVSKQCRVVDILSYSVYLPVQQTEHMWIPVSLSEETEMVSHATFLHTSYTTLLKRFTWDTFLMQVFGYFSASSKCLEALSAMFAFIEMQRDCRPDGWRCSQASCDVKTLTWHKIVFPAPPPAKSSFQSADKRHVLLLFGHTLRMRMEKRGLNICMLFLQNCLMVFDDM